MTRPQTNAPTVHDLLEAALDRIDGLERALATAKLETQSLKESRDVALRVAVFGGRRREVEG